jgi:glycosyltransferase involved in cell wall biosynthesis
VSNPQVRAVIVTTLEGLPGATVASTSFLHAHPGSLATVAVVDARFHSITIPDVEVLHTADIALLLGESLFLETVTSVRGELATRALRPRILAAILRSSPERVVVVSIPDDAEIEGPLVTLLAGASRSGVALVPARLSDLPADGKLPDTISLAASGRFDQELLACTNVALSLLDAWIAALTPSPHVPLDRIDPLTHPWLDSLAVTHGAFLVREPSIGVSFRNAEETGRSFAPLLLRYPAFDHRSPWIASGLSAANPRIRPSDLPWFGARLRKRAEEIAAIEAGYGFETRPNVITLAPEVVGGWDTLDDGTVFDDAMRLAYRHGALDAPRREFAPPPNPFVSTSTSFFAWLNEVVATESQLTRYLKARHSIEPGLALLFPDATDPSEHGFVAWVQAKGRQHGILGSLIPSPRVQPLPFAEVPIAPTEPTEPLLVASSDPSSLSGPSDTVEPNDDQSVPEPSHQTSASSEATSEPQLLPLSNTSNPPSADEPPAVIAGINVVGLLRAEFGIGTAARLLLRSVERAGVPFAVSVDDATAHRQEHPLTLEHQLPSATQPIDADEAGTSAALNIQDTPAEFPYPLTVIVLNADGLRDFSLRKPYAVNKKTVVGLWFWEVEEFPQRFWPAFDLVDEVWVASEHVRAALAPATEKPVRVIPLGAMNPTPDRPALRIRANDEFGIGEDRFVVTYIFDYASVAERKNPWGAVEAFCKAFPRAGESLPDGRVPVLLLKTISSERHPADVEHLRYAIGNRTDIVVVDTYLSSYVTTCLLARTDCYLSLHRAEGWGLTIAEAMAVATPVVATGYSGNMDFMDTTCTYVVPGKLVAIPSTTSTYAGAGRWADPDIDVAAKLLVKVSADQSTAEAMGLAGQERIRSLASSFDGADFIREQINRVADEHRALQGSSDSVVSSTSLAQTSHPLGVTMDDNPNNTGDSAQAQTQSQGQAEELESTDASARRSSLAHPGLGPVILPPSDYQAPALPGARGAVRTQIEKAIKFEIDRRDIRDHQRSAAIVDAIRETREAVRDTIDLQLRDQDTLTTAIDDTNAYLRDLHASHSALHASVVDMGRHTHEQGKSIEDLGGEISQLRDRVEQLSRVIERLTEKLVT